MAPNDYLPFEKAIYEMEELLAKLEAANGGQAGGAEEIRRHPPGAGQPQEEDLRQPDAVADRSGVAAQEPAANDGLCRPHF